MLRQRPTNHNLSARYCESQHQQAGWKNKWKHCNQKYNDYKSANNAGILPNKTLTLVDPLYNYLDISPMCEQLQLTHHYCHCHCLLPRAAQLCCFSFLFLNLKEMLSVQILICTEHSSRKHPASRCCVLPPMNWHGCAWMNAVCQLKETQGND